MSMTAIGMKHVARMERSGIRAARYAPDPYDISLKKCHLVEF
jgi:hypothetical protein